MRKLKQRAKRRRKQLLAIPIYTRCYHWRWNRYRGFNVHDWYLRVHGEDPRRA